MECLDIQKLCKFAPSLFGLICWSGVMHLDRTRENAREFIEEESKQHLNQRDDEKIFIHWRGYPSVGNGTTVVNPRKKY